MQNKYVLESHIIWTLQYMQNKYVLESNIIWNLQYMHPELSGCITTLSVLCSNGHLDRSRCSICRINMFWNCILSGMCSICGNYRVWSFDYRFLGDLTTLGQIYDQLIHDYMHDLILQGQVYVVK